MKILITGGNGQLGQKIKEILSPENEVISTDIDIMDITHKDQVFRILEKTAPDVIIHGAAYTKVDDAEENIAICRRINSFGTQNIAEAVKILDIPLIYISTDYVFDGKKRIPYKEDDPVGPLSVYGLTKLEGEQYITKSLEKFYIIRVSWLFGELPKNYQGSNFIETMLRLSKTRDSLSIVNDQIGSPTYTKDLVIAINKIIKQNIPYGIYHFSGDNQCSWFDFAKEIFDIKNIKINLKPISSDQYPQKARRPAFSYLSKKKIEAALGLKVRSWQEMVKDYLTKQ